MKYRLRIAYVGTDYAGWQRQDNALAIQQVVEEALARILGQNVTVHGAGRTDAGVHARGQVAHLTVAAESAPEETRRALVHGANRHLPAAIRVLDADAVDNAFYARKSAAFKVYRYRLCSARVIDPFRAPFVVPAPAGLDLEAMKTAASLLLGRHDFSAFAKSGRQPRPAGADDPPGRVDRNRRRAEIPRRRRRVSARHGPRAGRHDTRSRSRSPVAE